MKRVEKWFLLFCGVICLSGVLFNIAMAVHISELKFSALWEIIVGLGVGIWALVSLTEKKKDVENGSRSNPKSR